MNENENSIIPGSLTGTISFGTEWTDCVCLIDDMLRWKAVKQNQAHGSQAQRHPGGALQRQGGLRNNWKG